MCILLPVLTFDAEDGLVHVDGSETNFCLTNEFGCVMLTF